ncbi:MULTISPECIES: hypothetical protein [Haloarcula]|uniref:Uncharacterized protein n=1 Tax=Haloarcula pellucida TaxID=1427151 RepID=A0A830GFX6_9EURY|nr:MULTISPECIES: hypothetical protein [Halomicroarcula]MBX0346855.1 hypothetical protein [Halomicroarcula pellucida]MDS0277271.1 hypothetical protein [Halomicroarcula sp. S1AR25-4]GGN85798.1 hypothetical protein GCM10009030_02750 [Halomicroarcula pellucida]
MVNATKWLGLAATVVSVVVILLPAVFSVPHTQALTNLLVGEVAALAVGHSTYRAASGKQAVPLAAVTGIVCGLLLTVSPMFLYAVDPFLTVMLLFGLVVTAGGAAALVDRYVGGEEGRQTGAQRIAKRAGN